jgi:hypothetical protein
MHSIIKTTVLAAVGAAMFASAPAFAQKAKRVAPPAPATGYHYSDPTIVTENGTYLGRDPDIQVRSQLLKDDSTYNGNSY